MKPLENDWYEIRTAGDIEEFKFNPSPSRCGDIKDGILVEHGNGGVWLINYEDLILMAKMATKARQKRESSGGE